MTSPNRQKIHTPAPKKQITIRIEEETVNYFKSLAVNAGIPYQSLINLYLKDCVQSHRSPSFKWA